jgi:hypothetical protein
MEGQYEREKTEFEILLLSSSIEKGGGPSNKDLLEWDVYDSKRD